MTEISPLVFYRVPSNVKIRLTKPMLYENLTHGLKVYDILEEGMSEPKSVMETLYKTLFADSCSES